MWMKELARAVFYATLSGHWGQSGLFKYALNPSCVYSCCPPQNMDGLHTDAQVEPFPHPVVVCSSEKILCSFDEGLLI